MVILKLCALNSLNHIQRCTDTLSRSERRRWAPAFQSACSALDPPFQGAESDSLFWLRPNSMFTFWWFTLLDSLLEVAATETPGQSFGESMKATDKRMTAERWQLHIFFAANNFWRCAELSLVAIVNKLPESWICFRPVLPLMYASQYLPGISKFVFVSFSSSYHSLRHSLDISKLGPVNHPLLSFFQFKINHVCYC